MDGQEPDPDLLKRYFAGRCTPEENRRVVRWLSRSEPMPDPDPDAFAGLDRETLRKGILAQVKRSSKPAASGNPRALAMPIDAPERSGFRKQSRLWKIAAAMALAACVGYLATLPLRKSPAGLLSGSTAEDGMREVRTANGQKAVITLSDGTRVHLNSGSVLRFPRAFPSASREVRLEGEAFFQVAHDSLRPFSVRTAAATATVLGTAFDVRAYPEDPVTTVAVVEGRVRFAASATSGSSLLMTAGHLGRHRAGTDSLSLMALRNGDFPAWKDNDLVFADQPLSEIARTLERWYGIRVEIRSQALSRTRFTGRYHKPRLHDLIRDMSQVTRFRFTYGNRTLILEQP